MNATATSTRKARTTSPPGLPGQVVLVLQGGGALGAYQVGVYEALHDAGIEPDWVIGTSIGAINAALIAGNPPDQRMGRLNAFWEHVEQPATTAGPLDWLGMGNWVANMTTVMRGIPAFFEPSTAALRGVRANVGVESAAYYSTDPLRETLAELVDFDSLQAGPTRLTVGAVNACTGAMRYFDSQYEALCVEHVMASGALPPAFPAVRIDGEPYWDGGFLANPPLWPLFYDDTPDDILLVSLNPFVREETPKTPGEIMDRLNEITFNAALASELRAIGFVRKLLDEGLLKDNARGRYRRMLMHAITADKALADLSLGSKFDTEWSFLIDLRERGHKAADDWLGHCLTQVGVSSSFDLKDGFP